MTRGSWPNVRYGNDKWTEAGWVPQIVLEAQTKCQCHGHVGTDLKKKKKQSSCQPVVLLRGNEAFGVGFRERKLRHCVLPLKGLLGFMSLSVSFFWLLTGHEAISFSTMPFQYDVLAQKKHSKWSMS